MNRSILIAALCFCTAIPSPAQDEMSGMTGFRAEFLGWFQSESDKVLQLAEAIPEEKYSWAPGEGVRSVSQVMMHIASTNIFLPGIIRGEELDVNAIMAKEKTVTAKADVRKELKSSFKNVTDMVKNMSDKDLEKSVTIEFAQITTTARGVLMLVFGHLSEHLGQSIAYARMNDITPPWSLPPPDEGSN